MLRGKGIHYDTGTFPNGDTSRPVFDPRDAERDMRVIAKDLHCTAVRITGGDPDRIETTARYAANAGLEVWFSPFPCELANDEMLPLFTDCAERAERLRRDGAAVTLVTGCELSLFARGYLPGDTFNERVPILAGPDREAALQGIPDKVNAFLGEVVDTVRPLFGGRVSYASCPLDGVDWTPFDIVGLDAFRGLRNAPTYRDDLRKEFAHGKPVAIMEAGCCTYRGAGDHGGAGWYMAKEADGVTLKPDLIRDESEQVRYLADLMTVFEEEGVDSVFWFSFAGFATPTARPDRTRTWPPTASSRSSTNRAAIPRAHAPTPICPGNRRKRSTRSPVATRRTTGRKTARRSGRRRPSGPRPVRFIGAGGHDRPGILGEMRSMDPFRDEARSRGVPEDEVERWLGTVRRCAMLSPAGQAPPDGPVAGRLGGLPPMPEDEPVPDLPFLASVDLAAIPPGATDLPLPRDGTLLFFADTEDPWSDDDWSRLVHVPAGTPVSEHGPGGEWPPQVHPARDLHLTIGPSLPNRGSDTEEFPHGSELGSVWWKTCGEMQADGPVQMGGYPWVWNADPITEHDHGPGDWVLLAEVGGEDLTEGELGVVYWVIRRDDLAAGRFTRVRACFDMVG